MIIYLGSALPRTSGLERREAPHRSHAEEPMERRNHR